MFSADTNIICINGVKNISNIDYCWDGNSWVGVKSEYVGTKKLNRVYFIDGSIIECTPDQVFYVSNLGIPLSLYSITYNMYIQPNVVNIFRDDGSKYNWAFRLGNLLSKYYIYNRLAYKYKLNKLCNCALCNLYSCINNCGCSLCKSYVVTSKRKITELEHNIWYNFNRNLTDKILDILSTFSQGELMEFVYGYGNVYLHSKQIRNIQLLFRRLGIYTSILKKYCVYRLFFKHTLQYIDRIVDIGEKDTWRIVSDVNKLLVGNVLVKV
jgi:hypothetical protein